MGQHTQAETDAANGCIHGCFPHLCKLGSQCGTQLLIVTLQAQALPLQAVKGPVQAGALGLLPLPASHTRHNVPTLMVPQ